MCDCEHPTRSELLDGGMTSLAEQLQDVLQRRYRDTCPNCAHAFSLFDLSYDRIRSRKVFLFRIVCQNCGQVFMEIKKDEARYGDEISDFIRYLDRDNPIK
jgi:C4-type Zn-finger protein